MNTPLLIDHVRVVCIDDHWLVGDCLQRCLETAGHMCVGVGNRAADIDNLVSKHNPDLVIIDVKLSDDPFHAIAELRRARSSLRTLFLTADVSRRAVRSALRVGSNGIFSKVDPPDELLAGIRLAANNRYAFGQSVINLYPALRTFQGTPQRTLPSEVVPGSNVDSLSEREQEVLNLMGQGMRRNRIAEHLHRSPKTIDKHRAAVMRKLNIHDRAELVLFAVREGLVEI